MIKSKFLRQVTVTGADNSVNYYDLFDMAREYPFAEWGILLSKNSEGFPRFPTWEWIEGCIAERPPEMHLSGHLCGSWVRDIVSGGTAFVDLKRDFSIGFDRYQLNFHGQQHTIVDQDKFTEALVLLTGVRQQPIIFQMDKVNELLYHWAHSLYGRSRGIYAHPLFDVSGGAGILPKQWPQPMGEYCGYAGGLSPDNLAEQLKLIQERIRNKDGSLYPIWIDAETHIRSRDDQRFDLSKVAAFLEAAKPHVIGA